MSKHIFSAAFFLGAMTLAWVASGFVGTNFLALAMTLLIAAAYLIGAFELKQFRQASAGLQTALGAIPVALTRLGDWLEQLPPALQNAVRLRIEGERTALPGPSLTPFLIGLLVMLGMLGTFVGMVVTLNGAVFALEGTTDLQAIRSALAAPIKGLGLAFGTSVAGVAASAMLGLMSAVSRRERQQAVQLLDTRIATDLRPFSAVHQRQESFKALQLQTQLLPAVVDQLQALVAQMERREQQLSANLTANQQAFHRDVTAAYTMLASSVEQSLRESLGASARIAGDSLRPVVTDALDGIAREARLLHERMIDSAATRLQGLGEHFTATTATLAESWQAALASHRSAAEAQASGLAGSLDEFNRKFAQGSDRLLAALHERLSAWQAGQATGDRERLAAWTEALQSVLASLQEEQRQAAAQALARQQEICSALERSAHGLTGQLHASATGTLAELARLSSSAEDLLRARIESDARWNRQQDERMDQLVHLWTSELAHLRDAEAHRGTAAVERLGELEVALTRHLSSLGAALEDPIARLMQSASEAPRAAAEVITQLRRELSDSMARDNAVLEERGRILATLNSLLEAISQTSAQQRQAIDALITSSAGLLDRIGLRFAENLDAESSKMAAMAAQLGGSAVEVASLGESFGFAVQSFNTANEKLVANLQRIETSLDKSMQRSDEQLAYYVAQAREIIDLSLMSQRAVVEDLRRLSRQDDALVADEVS